MLPGLSSIRIDDARDFEVLAVRGLSPFVDPRAFYSTYSLCVNFTEVLTDLILLI